MSPKFLTNFEELEVTVTFFQDLNFMSVYDLGDNEAESPGAEIDDEHIRNVLVSSLYVQERSKCESEASLSL